jgi:two-component system, LuxR family, sensor kinase FixL
MPGTLLVISPMSDHIHILEKYINNNCTLVIYDELSERVVWFSNNTSKNACIANDNTSSDLESLLQISTESIDRFRQFIDKCSGNKDSENIFIDLGNVIYLDRSFENHLVFRVESTHSQDLAHTRYLRDREKLLFTSRSITVSEMASTLAHEINQPIGTISNLLNGIKARITNARDHDDEIVEALNQAIEQAKFTSNIISRVRDYTQSRQPKKGPVNVNGLVAKCVSLMDWEIKNTCVEIASHSAVDKVSVLGDELMLQQVIINLIRNGIDATAVCPKNINKISITTIEENNYVKISIEDNGRGLNEEEAQSLFIPFASNKSNGMGIGLNICRTFIELHKGKLWLTRNVGSGCTSHIMLPIYT